MVWTPSCLRVFSVFVASHRCGLLVKLTNSLVYVYGCPVPVFRITRCIKITCMCGCTRRAHWASHKDMQHIKEEKRSAWSDKRSCVLPGKSCTITTAIHRGLMLLQVKGVGDGNLNGLLCVRPETNPQLINCWCPTLVASSGKTFVCLFV